MCKVCRVCGVEINEPEFQRKAGNICRSCHSESVVRDESLENVSAERLYQESAKLLKRVYKRLLPNNIFSHKKGYFFQLVTKPKQQGKSWIKNKIKDLYEKQHKELIEDLKLKRYQEKERYKAQWYKDNKEHCAKRSKLYREKNKEIISAKNREKRKNPEWQAKRRSYVDKYTELNREMINAKKRKYYEKNKKHFKEYRDYKLPLERKELHDNYIKKLIARSNDLTFSDIPPEAIELKRAQLKLYREINK